MNQKLNITYIQSDLIWEDRKQNLNNFTKKINSIQNQTDLILLPEMFPTGFSMKPEPIAESMPSESLDWMRQTARKTQAAICGTLIVKEKDDYFNRLFFVKPDNTYEYYDKRHLFRMSGEDKHYSPGTKKTIIEYKNWRIRPLICYDLRFPVWSRNQNDYDLLLYLANWPASRIEVWKTLLKARALENQSYCVGVNRIGTDGYGAAFNGSSMIIDAKGKFLSQAKDNEEGIYSTTIDRNELDEFRKRFPAYLDADMFEIKI